MVSIEGDVLQFVLREGVNNKKLEMNFLYLDTTS